MFLKILLYILLSFCLFGCSDSRSAHEQFRGKVLSQLAKQMRKQNLYAIGSGGGCTREGKVNLIEMTFIYKDVLTLTMARKLMVESAKSLLTLMNTDPNNKQYFEVFPAFVEIIHITIIGETPSKGDLNKIGGAQLTKGNIRYLIDNPNPLPQKEGPLLTIHKETFEEAKKILCHENSLK